MPSGNIQSLLIVSNKRNLTLDMRNKISKPHRSPWDNFFLIIDILLKNQDANKTSLATQLGIGKDDIGLLLDNMQLNKLVTRNDEDGKTRFHITRKGLQFHTSKIPCSILEENMRFISKGRLPYTSNHEIENLYEKIPDTFALSQESIDLFYRKMTTIFKQPPV